MDISLNRTIVYQHWILILFTSFGWWELVLAFIDRKGLQVSVMSQCPFNMVSASPRTIVYCHLDCRVLAGQYAWRALTGRDFALLNDEDLLFTKHGQGKLFGELLSEQLSGYHQSCCQRAAYRGLLSGWLLSKDFWQSGSCQSGSCRRASVRGLLSEWLLSESCCQRASVRVVAVRVKVSEWITPFISTNHQ